MVNDFETQLAELDLQVENLLGMNTADHAVASALGALQGKRAALLNAYGKEIIEGSEKSLKKHKAIMQDLKDAREEAKHEVVRTFMQTALAVKVLRDTEIAIKKAHTELQAVLIEINRTQGKPFDQSAPPAIHYRAIGARDRLGALDNWYGIFAGHFGKMAVQTDNVISISKERFFDDG